MRRLEVWWGGPGLVCGTRPPPTVLATPTYIKLNCCFSKWKSFKQERKISFFRCAGRWCVPWRGATHFQHVLRTTTPYHRRYILCSNFLFWYLVTDWTNEPSILHRTKELILLQKLTPHFFFSLTEYYLLEIMRMYFGLIRLHEHSL